MPQRHDVRPSGALGACEEIRVAEDARHDTPNFPKSQPSAAAAATDLYPPVRVDSQAMMPTEPDQLEWIVSGDKVRARDGDLVSRNFRGDDVRLQI